jgi:hypothetical protein
MRNELELSNCALMSALYERQIGDISGIAPDYLK